MTVITLEEMQAAAVVALGERLGEEKARALARKAMSFFGFDDSVVDNSLSPKDRDVFYILEEVGLVTTLEDETYIERGKRWRIHYWVLDKEKIKRLATGGPKEEEDAPSVYEDWGEDWMSKHEGKDI
ncbi:MAG: hypothetical protein KAT70_05695 [Thermoplasmata archaeon]|nr:hypothetical protein [Thermoplasmata archaeon]